MAQHREESSGSSITSKFSSVEPQDDHAPLWAFVTIKDKIEDGGGNKLWSCNFCEKVVKSSYSRVKAHLLRIPGVGVAVCPKVSAQYLADLKRICEKAENRLKPKKVPLPTDKLPPSLPQKRRKMGSGTIESAFNVEERNHLRADIARMFYSAGLSFHLARNPYFVSSYSFAANQNLSGFLPPSYNALRTSLLQQERSHIERLLQPIKSLWMLKGVTLVSDGWTDVQRRPLINFMAISEGGPIFLKAVDGSKEYKDKHYMASIIKDVIKEVHPCDKRRTISEYRHMFPAIDFSLIESDEDILWTSEREKKDEVAARGLKFLEWCWTRKEKEIAVVTHGSFLFNTLSAFGNACHPNIKSEMCTNFANCELRSMVIVDRGMIGSNESTTNYPGKIPRGPDLPSDATD